MNNKTYDLAIIGAGPAGLMAASAASRENCKIVVIEKNPSPGVKLLMSGNGRANITNYIENPKELIYKYGDAGKFLYSSFFNFSAMDTINYFNKAGLETKVENNNKVFPKSNKSRDVLDVLLNDIRNKGVEIKKNCTVKKIVKKHDKIEKIILLDEQEIFAKNILIATGGLSFPTTGSSGDAFKWAKDLGHSVTALHPALVPIYLEEKFINKIEGVSIKNLGIKLFKNSKLIKEHSGDIIFTADGISGPAILDISNYVDKGYSGYSLSLDFCPDKDFKSLENEMLKEFKNINNKQIKNSFDAILPKKIAELIINLSGVDKEKQINLMKKDERKIMLRLIKDFKLTVKGTHGFERAMLTRGGISLDEVDPKNMKSKIISNLYFAGEVLDLHGPSGGFNLQIAWSTGFCAGNSAAANC